MDKPSPTFFPRMSFIQLVAQIKVGALDTADFYLEALFLWTRKEVCIRI